MKIFAATLVLIASAMMIQAQNAPIDFEPDGFGADWTWTVFENLTNPALEVIANPDAAGVNTSATVAKFTALPGGAPFAGCESLHGSDIGLYTLDATNSTIKIMVWKSVISDVGVKLVAADNWSLGEIKIANTLVDQWEELTYDFTSNEGVEFDQIVIFPDFADRDQDNICYFDNIIFGENIPLEEPMTAAPDPTIDEINVISMFSNVYTDVPVDTWHTDWSAATLTDIQIDGNDTKKYAALDFVGVEAVGANVLDVSEMEFFHFDAWTPNMTSLRVKLVDFGPDGGFDGGDDSEHEIVYDDHAQNEWVSYAIPMAEFSGLTASEHIAQLIFAGSPAGQGVLYIDNVYFSKSPDTGIDKLTDASLSLYPNPASDFVTLHSDEAITSVSIINSQGQQVQSDMWSFDGRTVDLSNLASGVYFVNVKTANETLTSPLVIR
jgi:hypothetical protein